MGYRNSSNNARSASLLGREDYIKEAGEVFTTSETIQSLISEGDLSDIIADSGSTILEPAAGDGNFIHYILKERILSLGANPTFKNIKQALSTVWAVEIMPDNHETMMSRIRTLVSEHKQLTPSELREVDRILESVCLRGNFLTGRACLLSCPKDCVRHEPLNLPQRVDLVIGNPPYNPQAQYKDFTNKALEITDTVAFILPTSWFTAPTHAKFRREVLPRLAVVKVLPQDAFKIKMRTSLCVWKSHAEEVLRFDNKLVTKANEVIGGTILNKVYSKFKTNRSTVPTPPSTPARLFIGWKANLERSRGIVNALQSINTDPKSLLLPSNVYQLDFDSDKERTQYILYSSTKLAAYLQAQTHSDNVARYLPWPRGHNYKNDADLYSILALTPCEVEEIERYSLYVTHSAKLFYDACGIPVRKDAIIGKERQRCTGCGSSSFHKKGCRFSTIKEKELRDKIV